MLWIAYPDRTPVHPAAVELIAHDPTVDLDCREDNQPESALEREAPRRDTGFRLSGHFSCHRRIFNSAERNPFVETAIQAEEEEAKRVAMSLKHEWQGKAVTPVTVHVAGWHDPILEERVAAIFRTELAAVLGPGYVRRADEENALPLLDVQLKAVDEAKAMSHVRLKQAPAEGGEPQWQDI